MIPMNKTENDFDVEFRDMTDADWGKYVFHIVEANEIYYQYGCEPTRSLIECIETMTPGVAYYSVYLKAENVMIGYVGITLDTSELEFYIFSEFRKNGRGTNAVNLLIKSWFSGRITGKAEAVVRAETLSENLGSIRLLEKTVFQKERAGLRMTISENDANCSAIGLYAYVLNNANSPQSDC